MIFGQALSDSFDVFFLKSPDQGMEDVWLLDVNG